MLVHFVVALPPYIQKIHAPVQAAQRDMVAIDGKTNIIYVYVKSKCIDHTGGRMRYGTRNNESNFNNNYHFSCIAAKC